MESESDNIDQIKMDLFEAAMKSEWGEVIEIYKKDQRIHKARITRSDGTALHIAASDGQVQVVEELVKTIQEKQVFKIGDQRGNTPLHTAAGLGSVSMCKFIASADPKLIGARNHNGETPFFLAALHGHKGAFLCLHSFCVFDEDGYSYSRRKDGETILHYAISGDHFDLAFQIIHLYKDLVNYVNEQGLSPLHLLATKPNAFRSGCHLGRFTRITYNCIFVDLLQKDTSYDQYSDQFKTDKKKMYPENYETCINFIKLLKAIVKVFTNIRGTVDDEPHRRDAENPQVNNNRGTTDNEPQQRDAESPQEEPRRNNGQLSPPNYGIGFEYVKLVFKAMMIILGFGSNKIRDIREMKQKHTWAVQILDELLLRTSLHKYEYMDQQLFISVQDMATPDDDTVPFVPGDDQQPVTRSLPKAAFGKKEMTHEETPILTAAKNGITEVVEKILEKIPVAIRDMNSEMKNVVLIAVENRQPHVYKLLLERKMMKASAFREVDCNGNSALHLAATLGAHNPWFIAGPALQMQWEIKWFQFVRDSMPDHFFVPYNKKNMTPNEVFNTTHQELVETGDKWLTKTSQSCSVVAALIATVAFATSTTVPGGFKEETGEPNFENHPAFIVFAISSLLALGFSVTAVVMFLAILTRYEKLFPKNLHKQLLVGLTSLFASIASMLISFCAGHFIMVREKLKYSALPVYAVTCLPLTLFTIAQFPLYVDLLLASFKKEPYRAYKPALL